MSITDYHILAKIQSELYDRKFDSRLSISASNDYLVVFIKKDKSQAVIVDVVNDKIVIGYSFTNADDFDFEVHLSDPDCFKNTIDFITTAVYPDTAAYPDDHI